MRSHSLAFIAATVLACASAGCAPLSKMIAPSNVRDWEPDQAVLPYAEFHPDRVVVHNVRNCRYFGDGDYVLEREERRYNLADLRGIDFIILPFAGMPRLAHTMISFEFAPPAATPKAPPQRLICSIEIRKEKGETYAAWKGSARQYELMYVLADERDAVEVRTVYRNEDAYLYHTTATPEQARLMFVDVLARANELASRPEFYDTLTNNCTTNLVRHVNRIQPNRVPYDYHVLLPGYSDQLAYDEGLIEHHGTFEETKTAAFLNARALAAAGSSDFSQLIRR